MPLYMTEFAYTPETWTTFVKNPEDQTIVIRELTEKLGGRFVSLYYTFGEYDGFVLWEFPDETTVKAATIAAISVGQVRETKTTVALDGEAVLKAMHKAGAVIIQRPGQ